MATSGEKTWPRMGRNRWPLTDGPSTKKNAVWLGSDGRLYLPSGVTNVEIEVGVTPAPPLEVGFLDAGQLKAVREGLANLIVAHGLDWSGAAAGPG